MFLAVVTVSKHENISYKYFETIDVLTNFLFATSEMKHDY